MNKINLLFTLYSLTAVVIIIERLLPATKVFLEPYHFIRLHEINQTVIFLSITIVLSFLLIKEQTNNFQALKDKTNSLLLLFFIIGAYWFGAGEGWHEIASFTLNTYCDPKHLITNLCGGLYINDYYTGNIIFFIGGVLMNTAVMALTYRLPLKAFRGKELIILFLNSIVYAFTWFAYAAFDPVLVGLLFSTLLMIISLSFFFKVKEKWKAYPYITYSTAAYTLATIATLLLRFL